MDLIRGGHGRDPQEILWSAWAWAICVGILGVIVLVAWVSK